MFYTPLGEGVPVFKPKCPSGPAHKVAGLLLLWFGSGEWALLTRIAIELLHGESPLTILP
jgi:hypothetical protein